MGLTSQLQTFGTWGNIRQPFPFSLTDKKAWENAVKNNGVKGILRYSKNHDVFNEQTDKGVIALDYTANLPTATDGPNQKAQWSISSGDATKLYDLAQPFLAGVPGIAYYGVGSTNAFAIQSILPASNGLSIGANQGWCLYFYIAKPDSNNKYPVFTARIHDWQFQILRGTPHIMRLTSSFTQADEDAMNALLGQETISADDQATINQYRILLYTDFRSLSLGSDWYDKPNLVTFIPEPRGILNIIRNYTEFEQAENKTIITSNLPGVFWPDNSSLMLRTNGGQMLFWQVGNPAFARVGSLSFPRYAVGNYYWSGLPGVIPVMQHDATLPGVTLDFANNVEDNDIFAQVVISFTSSDGKYTPFLYGASAYIPSGTRTDTDETFNTDDFDDNPVMDITPSFDGEGRKAQYTLTMRDINGQTLNGVPGFHYSALENTTANLSIGGTTVLTTGIVKHASLVNMRAATPNLPRVDVSRQNTRDSLIICDRWAILEEDEMKDDPVGDGEYLSLYLRRVLTNVGEDSAGIAGIGTTSGRILPSARPGEPFAVRPQPKCKRSEWVNALLDRYGLGYWLYISPAGVWTFTARSTTPVFSFVSSPNNQDTGRNCILSPLDSIRDSSEFYNMFRVEGAEDANGVRIAAEHVIWESLSRGTGPESLKYIGRKKPYTTLQDDALKTRTDVIYALRSLVERHGRNPRFWQFETYYNPSLYPGLQGTVNTMSCEIHSIPSGSSRRDRMTITVRELGY